MNRYLAALLLLFIVMCLAYSCKSSRNSENETRDREAEIIDYAHSEFGSEYELKYNSKKDYVVLLKYMKTRPADIFPTLSFQVLKLEDMEMIFEDIVPRAKLEWIDEYIFEVKAEKSMPGPDGETKKPYTYKYHVINQKKYSGAFFNK